MNAKTTRTLRRGFTLVEMLVVILLIAVLAGIVFRMTTMANEKSAKAVTLARIAKLQAAIEEFYSEYGQYPPVPTYGNAQPVYYEYPSYEQVVTISGQAGSIRNADSNAGNWRESWERAPVFTFGLMSFLLPRYNDLKDDDYSSFGGYEGGAYAGFKGGNSSDAAFSLKDNKQWNSHNDSGKADNKRDVEACRRWWPYISDIVEYWYMPVVANPVNGEAHVVGSRGVSGYTNLYVTVRDGWNQHLNYRSDPPYQTYELWAMHDGKRIEAHAGH